MNCDKETPFTFTKTKKCKRSSCSEWSMGVFLHLLNLCETKTHRSIKKASKVSFFLLSQYLWIEAVFISWPIEDFMSAIFCCKIWATRLFKPEKREQRKQNSETNARSPAAKRKKNAARKRLRRKRKMIETKFQASKIFRTKMIFSDEKYQLITENRTKQNNNKQKNKNNNKNKNLITHRGFSFLPTLQNVYLYYFACFHKHSATCWTTLSYQSQKPLRESQTKLAQSSYVGSLKTPYGPRKHGQTISLKMHVDIPVIEPL